MKLKAALALLVLSLMLTPFVAGQEENEVFVERIEVEGNSRIKDETIIYYMETREGDLYNEKNFVLDFQNLWKTGLFSDLKIKVKDGVEGKIIIVEIKEQLIVDEIVFEGLEEVSSTDILEAADRAGMKIKRGDYLNMGNVSAMKQVTREVLKFKGYKVTEINHEIRVGSSGKCDVYFIVGEGTTIKIEEIRFIGNSYFSDWKIRKEMENLGNNHALTFLSSSDLYNELKLSEDVQKIRDLYWGAGFLDVTISEPALKLVIMPTLLSKKKATRYYLDININEGKQYVLNNVTVEGNSEFDSEMILGSPLLKKGTIYNHEFVKAWLEFLKRQYGHKGYVMVSLVDERDKNPKDMTVDINLKIKENEVYHVNGIYITGNRTTNDAVIRRQMLLAEGDVYDNKLVEMSVNRIRQLGFFDQNVDLKPKVNNREKEIDLNIEVAERGTTNLNFGIAYSELEGFYGNFAIETKNLFGSGNTFGISGQFGTLVEMFSLNYYDPWFLGKRVGLGTSLFVRNYDFPGYQDKRVGGTINLSYPISVFALGNISYKYQVVDIGFSEVDETDEDYYSYYNSYYYYYANMYKAYPWLYPEGETIIASITKSFKYNTVDHPLFPRTGSKAMVSLEYAASFLGGNIDFLKGTAELVHFFQPFKVSVIGMRAQVGWIESLSDAQIPILERYFLGGERTIRGLRIRSVGGEIDANGIPTGGTKLLLFNFEYQFLISNEMRLILFFDAGNAYSEDQEFSLSGLRKTAGVEARIYMPVFNVPIRLIFAYNLDPKFYENSTDFQFSMGMMF